jgi:uncharacterized protein (TIGR02145 family)
MYLKKHKLCFLIALFFLGSVVSFAQIQQKLGSNPMTISPSAILELESTTKGFLLPRMTTTQRDAIAPVAGLTIYNTTINGLQIYDGLMWSTLSGTDTRVPVLTGIVNGTGASGTMSHGIAIAASAVTQGIQVTTNASGGGPISISTNAVNGVVFSFSGVLVAGTSNITLTASGTPVAGGTFTYTVTSGSVTFTFPRTVEWLPAEIASIAATGASVTLTDGVAASGQTQALIAQVTKTGSYTLTTNAINGITFSTSGVFTSVGSNNFNLEASGTNIDVVGSPFTISSQSNTAPVYSFPFNVNINNNGFATFDGGNPTGTMNQSSTIGSGVTQTLNVSVTQRGSYPAISVTTSGVTFSSPGGIFASVGSAQVVLTASGTPSVVGNVVFSFTNPLLGSFTREVGISLTTSVLVSPGVSKLFLTHNLGADTAPDPSVPVQGIHGDYYQWGRSTIVADASTSSGVVSGWNTTAAANGAWADGSKTANDPCPTGYRVPTMTQWDGVIANNTVSRTGTWTDDATNFGSAIHWGPNAATKALTLPAAGFRNSSDGTLSSRGSNGYYWSSTENGANASYLRFNSSVAITSIYSRPTGFSVRCVSE